MRVFDGTITRFERRFEKDLNTQIMRELYTIEAEDFVGSNVRLDYEYQAGQQIPTVGMTLAVERIGMEMRVAFNSVTQYGLAIAGLSIEQSGAAPMASFGGAVKRSWECPVSLQEEARRRAEAAGMTVSFDVNKVTLVTQRGTLHVEVNPPEQMAGFTADMCMLTWQVEHRELGLAA